LCEEREASQNEKEELPHSLINATEVTDSTQKHLVEREARAQSQINVLMSQVASLRMAMAVQETECTMVDAALNVAEQGHQRLEAECQSLCSTCAYESSSSSILLSFGHSAWS